MGLGGIVPLRLPNGPIGNPLQSIQARVHRKGRSFLPDTARKVAAHGDNDFLNTLVSGRDAPLPGPSLAGTTLLVLCTLFLAGAAGARIGRLADDLAAHPAAGPLAWELQQALAALRR
jgi:hypothetical protein